MKSTSASNEWSSAWANIPGLARSCKFHRPFFLDGAERHSLPRRKTPELRLEQLADIHRIPLAQTIGINSREDLHLQVNDHAVHTNKKNPPDMEGLFFTAGSVL